ncbi:hypothetical protein Tco_0535587 [Tanacetum coccineum]
MLWLYNSDACVHLCHDYVFAKFPKPLYVHDHELVNCIDGIGITVCGLANVMDRSIRVDDFPVRPAELFRGMHYEEISEGGIPRVIVLGHDGLPLQPVAPPSPDYVLGLEYLQILPVPQDEDELALSHYHLVIHHYAVTRYVTESDPEEDPEEYEDDKTEDGPVDYPMDGGDDGYDGDDDDGDSSGDDARDEDEDEEDEEDEEEEEHLAPADSTVIPADEPAFPPEGTEPVIPPPSTDITIGARITIRPQTSISLPPEAEVERLLAMTTPSPSPPISLSPPSAGERLARDDIPESEQPPRKRLHLSTICSRYEIGESSTVRPVRGQGIDYGFISTVDAEERRQGIRDVGYGIRDTWVDPAEADLYALLDVLRIVGLYFTASRDETSSGFSRLTYGDRLTLQETDSHRDHVYAHETYLQQQTQLQPESTLIQTLPQVHETRLSYAADCFELLSTARAAEDNWTVGSRGLGIPGTRRLLGKPIVTLGWKLDGYQADGHSCVVLKMVLVGQVM